MKALREEQEKKKLEEERKKKAALGGGGILMDVAALVGVGGTDQKTALNKYAIDELGDEGDGDDGFFDDSQGSRKGMDAFEGKEGKSSALILEDVEYEGTDAFYEEYADSMLDKRMKALTENEEDKYPLRKKGTERGIGGYRRYAMLCMERGDVPAPQAIWDLVVIIQRRWRFTLVRRKFINIMIEIRRLRETEESKENYLTFLDQTQAEEEVQVIREDEPIDFTSIPRWNASSPWDLLLLLIVIEGTSVLIFLSGGTGMWVGVNMLEKFGRFSMGGKGEEEATRASGGKKQSERERNNAKRRGQDAWQRELTEISPARTHPTLRFSRRAFTSAFAPDAGVFVIVVGVLCIIAGYFHFNQINAPKASLFRTKLGTLVTHGSVFTALAFPAGCAMMLYYELTQLDPTAKSDYLDSPLNYYMRGRWGTLANKSATDPAVYNLLVGLEGNYSCCGYSDQNDYPVGNCSLIVTNFTNATAGCVGSMIDIMSSDGSELVGGAFLSAAATIVAVHTPHTSLPPAHAHPPHPPHTHKAQSVQHSLESAACSPSTSPPPSSSCGSSRRNLSA